MARMNALTSLMLAGLLLIPGNLGLVGRAWAQGGSAPLTEQQRQEPEQKYQERWQELERENQKTTGERLEEAVKRRQDAEKRRRAAERQLQEQEQSQGNPASK